MVHKYLRHKTKKITANMTRGGKHDKGGSNYDKEFKP